MRSKEQFHPHNKRRLLDILGVDVLPKIATFIDFVYLALEFRLEYSWVVALLVVVDVWLVLLLLMWLYVMRIHLVAAKDMQWTWISCHYCCIVGLFIDIVRTAVGIILFMCLYLTFLYLIFVSLKSVRCAMQEGEFETKIALLAKRCDLQCVESYDDIDIGSITHYSKFISLK